jgi:hypothetical protein
MRLASTMLTAARANSPDVTAARTRSRIGVRPPTMVVAMIAISLRISASPRSSGPSDHMVAKFPPSSRNA